MMRSCPALTSRAEQLALRRPPPPPACTNPARRRRSVVVSARAFNPFPFPMPPPPPDLSGDVLSAAATFALRTILRSHASIDADVDCTVPGLMTGQVDGVVISGKDWVSRQNLTCQSLRFAVGTVAIDQIALVAEQLVKLRGVATGSAELVFTANDFGNFLVHPLTRAASRVAGPGGYEFVFDGGPEVIKTARAVALVDGAVCFGGTWAKDGGRYRVAMRPKGEGAGVEVVTLEGGGGGLTGGEELARAMAEFFETLMVDLQGAQLTYVDMTVDDDAVAMSLSLRVVSFPPPNAQF